MIDVDTARVLVEAGIREALREVGDRRADVAPLVDRVIARLVASDGEDRRDDCDDCTPRHPPREVGDRGGVFVCVAGPGEGLLPRHVIPVGGGHDCNGEADAYEGFRWWSGMDYEEPGRFGTLASGCGRMVVDERDCDGKQDTWPLTYNDDDEHRRRIARFPPRFYGVEVDCDGGIESGSDREMF